MRLTACVMFAGLMLAFANQAAPLASAAGPSSPASEQSDVALKWLGNAGWEIRFSGKVILLDPWITRKEIPTSQEWRTDEAAVLNVVTTADYIFVTHSH